METENTTQKKLGVSISIVVVLGVLLATIFFGKQNLNAASADQNSVANVSSALQNSSTPLKIPKISKIPIADRTKRYVYKNGTYSATGSYMSPGGMDQIAVTLTLKNDIITNTSATPKAGDRTSARYMSKFISGYKTYVVGKNIANVSLSKVSGSSLTPKGFNDALAQIKKQAVA